MNSKDAKDETELMLEEHEYQGPSETSRVIRPRKKPMDISISLRLSADTLERARQAAEERGMGYHTFIRWVFLENLPKYEKKDP